MDKEKGYKKVICPHCHTETVPLFGYGTLLCQTCSEDLTTDPAILRLLESYMKRDTRTFKIICPYCNAPYTAQMEESMEATYEEVTCSQCPGSSISGTIDIYCDNCKGLVYRKEI